jgi:hypothetical protein
MEPITQEVYWYPDPETGQPIIDEELILAEFRDKLAERILNNMGIA